MALWIDRFETEYLPCLAESALGEKRSAKRGLAAGLYDRSQGFEIIFKSLLVLKKSHYNIVETGTMRNRDCWKDGQSSRLFTEFVDCYGGTVRSVDIDPNACKTSRALINSKNFSVTCGDSVKFLKSIQEPVDLYYLDSWDVRWDDDQLSAEHHLKEFMAIEQQIQPGTIVAIDDNAKFIDSGLRTGKGRLIVEYLEQQGIKPAYDAYQIIYKF